MTFAKSVSFNPVATITSLFLAVWSETSSKKESAYKLVVQEKRIQDSIGNVLDPLLKIIAVEYIDHASLTSSLAEIFHFLLKTVGEQGELGCDDLIRGISTLQFSSEYDESVTTRLHMTKKDYDTITQQGALANHNGALGAAEFDTVMRKQVHDYINRKLQRSVSETETLQDFASVASLKALVMEVDTIKAIQSELRGELKEMRMETKSSFSDLHLAVASLAPGDSLTEKTEAKSKSPEPDKISSCDALAGKVETLSTTSKSKVDYQVKKGAAVQPSGLPCRRECENDTSLQSALIIPSTLNDGSSDTVRLSADRVAGVNETGEPAAAQTCVQTHSQEFYSTTCNGPARVTRSPPKNLPYRAEWETSCCKGDIHSLSHSNSGSQNTVLDEDVKNAFADFIYEA